MNVYAWIVKDQNKYQPCMFQVGVTSYEWEYCLTHLIEIVTKNIKEIYSYTIDWFIEYLSNGELFYFDLSKRKKINPNK
jgi:hypothetical protein